MRPAGERSTHYIIHSGDSCSECINIYHAFYIPYSHPCARLSSTFLKVVSILNGDMPDQIKAWLLTLMLSLVHPEQVQLRGFRI